VEHSAELSQELSELIQEDCAIALPNDTPEDKRGLHLHNATSSQYLIPNNITLRRWNLCEQDTFCQELKDELVPVISQLLGYSWDKDAYFNATEDVGLLSTVTKLPPPKLVEKMNELDEKYSIHSNTLASSWWRQEM